MKEEPDLKEHTLQRAERSRPPLPHGNICREEGDAVTRRPFYFRDFGDETIRDIWPS